MKQVLQNYKSGKLELAEVPIPLCGAAGVLVKNKNSLISTGTEKLMISLAKKSLISKAKERPDLVKKVINKIKTEGLLEAYRQSMARLDETIPLGYSSAGEVIEVGKMLDEFQVGDRVACIGAGVATHTEVIFVPKNQCVKIPDEVSFEEASFVALGAIALHAVRVSEAKLGENVVVIGLGLLGQLAVGLLKASGSNVLGVDISREKNKLAKTLGAASVTTPDNLIEEAARFTKGRGADSVIIFASTKSNEPIEQAAEIARERAKIVAPGMIRFYLPRKLFYEKELELVISRSSGPGIYDRKYEEEGIDYPISYVRWTKRRNMEAFLEAVKAKAINLEPLITHRFKIENALAAYEMILEGKESYIGVLLEYLEAKPTQKISFTKKSSKALAGRINVGLIGAGLFAKGTILPILKDSKDINLKAVATAGGINAREIGKNYGFDYATTNYKEILGDKDIQAVIIATRHNLHKKFIIESLEAGKDVFCEKPLCINQEELEEIIKTYGQSNNRLMIGFNRRFSPLARFVKENLPESSPLVINCRVNTGFMPKEIWVHNPKIGGGSIIGEVCHFIDLIQYFTGSLPWEVSAYSISSEGNQIIPSDNVVINLKYQDGSIAAICYTASGSKSFPRERIEIFGGGKVGVIENFKKASVYGKGRTKHKKIWGTDKGHKDEYQIFFKAIEEGGEIPVDFKEYIATTLATFKIVESLKTGKPQQINL